MKLILATATALAFTIIAAQSAKADNPLTQSQLLKATQVALEDYVTVDADMAKSISGFRVSTVGNKAQVLIDMNSDGMHMSVKYLCIPQGADIACNQQQ